MRNFRFGIPMFLILIFGLPLVFGGFIDPRYPDYIVDPLVPCQEDGYFVHPRNCSWFYRCHSNENITRIPRRDYFECAPGTIFSQKSSVCGFGDSEKCDDPLPMPTPNCDACDIANVNIADGSCKTFELCPGRNDKSLKFSVLLCPNPKYGCERCTHLNACKEDEWLLLSEGRRPPPRLRHSFPNRCHPSPYSPQMQCPVTLPVSSCGKCKKSVSDCRVYDVCPNGVNSETLTLCTIGERVCDNCPAQKLCPDGEYFENVEETCYPSPDSPPMKCLLPTPAPCTNCSIQASFCIQVEVCENGSNPVSKKLCALAIKECTPCDLKEVMCSEVGSYFSEDDQKCHKFPLSSDLQCPTTESPTTLEPTEELSTTFQTTILTTAFPTEPPCNDCYTDTVRCAVHTVCPYGGPEKTMRFCRSATRVCEPCGSKEAICRPGEHYAMEITSCLPNPESREMQCRAQLTVREVIRNEQALSPKKTPVVQCSGENLLPQDQWIKEKFCKNYQSCFRGNGKPMGIIELCTNYFECIYDVIERDWNLVRSHCSDTKLFSYEARSCVAAPVDICRVF